MKSGFVRLLLAVPVFANMATFAARPSISEDRELKEVDPAVWDCRDRLEGSAKTEDGVERNRMKNRSATNLAGTRPPSFEMTSLLQYLASFEAETKGKHRKDLSSTQRDRLNQLEKQIVSFTGYLVLAYPGPPETTNCGSTDFHDWHLELFDQPLDHAPQIGDPTPVICEITPRTQNAVYRDNVRIQSLAAFIRAPDLTIEPTQHAARKIRVSGYLLWDDEHNGAADIGENIRTIGANKYHQPWRRTAWEIHPAMRIEALDSAPASPKNSPTPPPVSVSSATPNPPPPPSSPPQQEFVTVMAPVKIKILYGETVIPRGTRLRVLSHDAQTVTVSYLDGTYAIPVSSTDFR